MKSPLSFFCIVRHSVGVLRVELGVSLTLRKAWAGRRISASRTKVRDKVKQFGIDYVPDNGRVRVRNKGNLHSMMIPLGVKSGSFTWAHFTQPSCLCLPATRATSLLSTCSALLAVPYWQNPSL